MGIRTKATALLTAAVAITTTVIANSAPAHAVDETCWLALMKSDPAAVNIAFPDESAVYWGAGYQSLPGFRLRIEGTFPHARYMSFNAYDQAQRPLDALADVEISPDPGSANPFIEGARRDVSNRSYTVFIDFGPKPERPEDRAPNTIYTGTGQTGLPNLNGTFLYRVYTPDAGLDEAGGVGLPTVTLQTTDGGPAPQSVCADFTRPETPGEINDQIAESDAEIPQPSSRQTNPVLWRKFVNFAYTYAPSDTTRELGGVGGLFSNVHNAYLFAVVSREHGQVLVTRMRVPTFPDTRDGARKMRDGQVRYFSMCENHGLTQRFIACRADDQTVIGKDGYATYVMSTPEQRPATATAECGVTWLPWGPVSQGTLIYRHMLPATGFQQAVQYAEPELEAVTMGEYLPTSRYFADAASYDDEVGCR